MFDTLIASGHLGSPRRFLPGGGVALLAHLAVISAAVWATLPPASPVGATAPPIVLAWPEDPATAHRPPGPSETIAAPLGLPVDVPGVPPIGLPPVVAGTTFDPGSWLHAVAGSSTRGIDSSGAWSPARVEEPPALLSAPPPDYPEPLRRAGIAGRVVVETVIDTLGRAEPRSLVVVESPNPGFATPARDYVLRALFRPGRIHDRAVRVLVRVPIEFRLTR